MLNLAALLVIVLVVALLGGFWANRGGWGGRWAYDRGTAAWYGVGGTLWILCAVILVLDLIGWL
jgi:hypothetical protein